LLRVISVADDGLVTVQFRRRTTGEFVDGFESVAYGDWYDVEGCALKYGLSDGTEDDSVERDKVLHGVIVYAPPMEEGEPPGEYDEARLPNDAESYRVAGRPVRWINPLSHENKGTEIRLERTSG
jgi:hypothetical protein